MFPVKAENVPMTASSEALLNTFKSFGEVGDVYIPVDLKSRKPKKDFAVIRFTDRKAAEEVLQLSESSPDKLTQSLGPGAGQLRLSPLKKQPSFFTNNTGWSVIVIIHFAEPIYSISLWTYNHDLFYITGRLGIANEPGRLALLWTSASSLVSINLHILLVSDHWSRSGGPCTQRVAYTEHITGVM